MSQKNSNNSTTPDPKIKQRAAIGPIGLGFLFRLIIKVGLVLGCGVLIPAGIFWLITDHLNASTYSEVLQNINRFQLILLQVTVLSAAGQIVLAIIFISLIALFASHKIAGPLIRFERHICDLGAGNFRQSVSFRRGDQDRSLPEAFRKLCERLRRRVTLAKEVRDSLSDIRKKVDSISSGAASISDTAEIQEMINEQVQKLRDTGTFKQETTPVEV